MFENLLELYTKIIYPVALQLKITLLIILNCNFTATIVGYFLCCANIILSNHSAGKVVVSLL